MTAGPLIIFYFISKFQWHFSMFILLKFLCWCNLAVYRWVSMSHFSGIQHQANNANWMCGCRKNGTKSSQRVGAICGLAGEIALFLLMREDVSPELSTQRECKQRLSLAWLCSQCVRSRSKEVLTGRYRNNCWWMRAYSYFMSVNFTYQRMLSACFVVLYKLSCMLFWHNFLLCKHFTNYDMKQLVLPTAPVLWCLAAQSLMLFFTFFVCSL